LWTPSHLLRLLFLYAGALFYGHVLGQLRRERARADRGFARARELEAKVAERTAQLQRLYEQCLAASRLKSEFIASVSHELRTPLHIMMGYTEMLLDGDGGRTSAERDQMVARIREASEGLLQLVDGLLDLRMLESGKMPLQLEPVRLAAFIGHFQRRERIPVPPGVALRWRIDPALPEIETDVAKLSIVLDNLVNNAIKFTREGTITVSARDVAGEQHIVLAVEDTGPGIPSEHLTAIFEPFHQVDGRAQRVDGVGLGLAIVRDYVSLLGGEISVCSKLGVGTSFEVTLPYRPGKPTSVTRPAAPREEQRAA
jgi:signal transduction histidine kinase